MGIALSAGIRRPSARVREGGLELPVPEDTEGHTRASGLAIDPAAPARPSGQYRLHPDSPRGHHGSHPGGPAAGSPVPLNTAAPPRRECARRGLDPIPPPNREDRTM